MDEFTIDEPTFIDTPKGDQLVILTRAAYDALVSSNAAFEDAEDAADIATGTARLAEWEAEGRPAYPLAVVRRLRSGDSVIRAFRAYRGMTQMQLAAKAGIGQGHLSDIESGRKDASPATYAAIAAALDVTAASLQPLAEKA